MRLFLGMLILTNILVSIIYWVVYCTFDGSISKMLTFNGIWTVLYSLLYFSSWLIEPYIN